MKTLYLTIKQQYFDEILAGTKTEEYREVRPTTFKKYLRYVVDGKEYDSLTDPELAHLNGEFEFDVAIKHYDALNLCVGYNKDRDTMLVEVADAYLTLFEDEDGEPLMYEYKGDNYQECQMTYVLGRIIEKNVHPKNK